MKRALSLFLVLSFALLLAWGAEAKRVFKPEDFASIREVDEPKLSPDGRSVVYVVGTVDLRRINSRATFGSRNGTARKIAPSLSAKPNRRIRAGARTASGSLFFPTARMKTRTSNSGFSPVPAAKRNS